MRCDKYLSFCTLEVILGGYKHFTVVIFAKVSLIYCNLVFHGKLNWSGIFRSILLDNVLLQDKNILGNFFEKYLEPMGHCNQ